MQDNEETIPPKEIKISTSSVINLKSELSKREAEFHRQKQSYQTTRPTKLKSIKQNKGVNERAEKDLIGSTELSQLEASWVALKRKSKLYDKLQEEGADAEEDESLLVDFLMKNTQEKPKKKKHKVLETPSVDEWVEVTDEFGRTRIVKKQDVEPVPVQYFLNLCRFVQADDPSQAHHQPGLVSDDMRRDAERREWEESAKHEPLNMHFNSKRERRNMGVGFYQLSQDQAVRDEQMKELLSIRNDTLTSRSKAEVLKEKRKARLAERKMILEDRARKRKEGGPVLAVTGGLDEFGSDVKESVDSFLSTI